MIIKREMKEKKKEETTLHNFYLEDEYLVLLQMKFWAVLIKICSRVLTDDRNLQIIPQFLVTVLDRFIRLNPVLYKLPPCILIANKETCWEWNKCKYVFLCRIWPGLTSA